MRAFLVISVGLVATAAAAIVLKPLLLDYTSPPGEPVGKLSPAAPAKLVRKPAPLPVTEGGGRDD